MIKQNKTKPLYMNINYGRTDTKSFTSTSEVVVVGLWEEWVEKVRVRIISGLLIP